MPRWKWRSCFLGSRKALQKAPPPPPAFPAPCSYLSLLQEGAHHWELDPRYTAWLDSLPSVDSRDRGDAYYTAAASGEPLPALPKIRTGSQPQQGRGGGRGGRGGGRGGGRRSGERRGGERQGT